MSMSYLLHPMFNTLRTKKRKSKGKTKELLIAEKKHKKWLLTMGIDGKKKTPPPKTGRGMRENSLLGFDTFQFRFLIF